MEELIKKTIAELRRDASSGWTGGPAAAKVLAAAFAEVRRAAITDAMAEIDAVRDTGSAEDNAMDTLDACWSAVQSLLPPAAEERGS